MTTPEDDTTQRALRREWAAARLVVIGGLIVGLAIVGYLAYQQKAAADRALQEIASQSAERKINAKALAEAELAVCSAELIRAKAIGIVPNYGVLVSPHLIRGNIANRYVCEAGTSLTRYYIAADIRCNKLAEARCVSVYRIALKGGTLVYSRPR